MSRLPAAIIAQTLTLSTRRPVTARRLVDFLNPTRDRALNQKEEDIRAKVIILNGTSSSGKTSIARAIQHLIGAPCMHVALDAFIDMFCWEAIEDPEERRVCHAFGVRTFHRALLLIIAGGHLVVVDHVFERRSWYDAFLAAAQEAGILLVGVRCPLEVVEERERTRENRRNGLARSQFSVIHESKPYDLEVDTSVLSPEACAKVIVDYLVREVRDT